MIYPTYPEHATDKLDKLSIAVLPPDATSTEAEGV